MATFERKKIIEQLESLKNLPQIKEVKALRQRLERELENLTEKEIIKKIPTEKNETLANIKRSSKLSRYWRYIRLVRDSFPNLKVNQIRRQFKKRQQGEESDIPDAVWQNPSG